MPLNRWRPEQKRRRCLPLRVEGGSPRPSPQSPLCAAPPRAYAPSHCRHPFEHGDLRQWPCGNHGHHHCHSHCHHKACLATTVVTPIVTMACPCDNHRHTHFDNHCDGWPACDNHRHTHRDNGWPRCPGSRPKTSRSAPGSKAARWTPAPSAGSRSAATRCALTATNPMEISTAAVS